MKNIFKVFVFPFQFVFSRKVADSIASFLIKYKFMQYVLALVISAVIVILMYYINTLA